MTQYCRTAGHQLLRSTSGGWARTSSVELGEPIVVTGRTAAAPGRRTSLYTNVIEALLRFVAVSRGAILLHSACIELDGVGILLSARDRHRQDRHRAADGARAGRAASCPTT